MPLGRAKYYEKIRKAADGAGEKAGGLSKERVGEVMKWAAGLGLVSERAVFCGKPSAVRLRTSVQLRRSLKFNLEAILYEMSYRD